MRHTTSVINRPSLKLPAAFALCCLLSLAACSIAQAQSGRRVSKRPTPAPAPSTEAKPTPTVAKAAKPELSLYVCTNDRALSMEIPRYYSENIRNIFVQRISQASNIDVTTGPDTQRGEAIKRAKSNESVYVVLLQLDVDTFDSQRTTTLGNIDPSQIIIRYTVFAPTTGKVKLEGRVYQRQYRMGRGGVGLPSPRRNNPVYSDYLLKEAARDAADRVLASFNYQPTRDPGLNGK
ncbi:MAG TPA: hypothetical protein VF528_19120 [Pyrinomonadaceae bacterium]|jgi:hypothetical protein